MKYNLTREQLIEKNFELTGRYRIAFNGVTFILLAISSHITAIRLLRIISWITGDFTGS